LDRDIAAWGEALGLLVEAAEERSCHAESGRGKRKSAEDKAEACVNGEVEDLVIGQREKIVHFFDSAGGQGGGAEDEKIVEDGRE
jgi:hypothetical protein